MRDGGLEPLGPTATASTKVLGVTISNLGARRDLARDGGPKAFAGSPQTRLYLEIQ